MKYKVFKDRVSLYDHLSQTNPYIHGIYQVVKVQFTFFLVYIFLRDSYNAGRPWLDLSDDARVMGGLTGWLVLLLLELVFFLLFVLNYPVFFFWKFLRGKVGVVSHLVYGLLLLGYGVISFYILTRASALGLVSGVPRAVAAIEWSRFLMKVISFVHENAYKVMHPWKKEDEGGPSQWYGGQLTPRVGTFSQYLYFLVAPTLVYRDYYPRNKGGIKWRSVLEYALQFVTAYTVSKTMFMLQYPKSFEQDDLVELFLRMVLASPLMYFLASLMVLHAWFNLTAELTRFADREFYLNWWSALGYSEYYRLWNVPIHDFTNIYIYQSLKPFVPRALAGLVVFILSACMHDFLIGFSLGFYLPVFLILFAAIGGVVFASGIKFSKYMTFLFTCCGYLIYEGIYMLELKAREECTPNTELPLVHLHSPYCFQLKNNVSFTFWS